METKIVAFALDRGTKNTVRYEGQPSGPPVMATVYIQKWMLGSPLASLSGSRLGSLHGASHRTILIESEIPQGDMGREGWILPIRVPEAVLARV